MAGEKILIADDEPHVRKLLERYLSHHGYVVGLAADGLEALELVRQQTPDLVITDVNMPNMNGLELTRRLRTSHKTALIPILMLSAQKQETDVLAGYAQGADEYVGKPVELSILKAKIEILLRRAGQATAAASHPSSSLGSTVGIPSQGLSASRGAGRPSRGTTNTSAPPARAAPR